MPQDGHVEGYRVEHEFPTIGRRVMLLNAHRIEGDASRPGLILLAIDDITEIERARFELEGQREYAEKLIDSIREALIVLGWDLRVKHANQPFYDTFKVSPADTEGHLIYELGNGQWNIPKLRRLLEDILPHVSSFDDFEVTHEFKSIGRRSMRLNARRLDHLNLILLAIEDVTERTTRDRRREMLARELSHRVKNILTLVDAVAEQTARKSDGLGEFREAFHGRLRAIGRSHGQWLAEESTTADLRTLVTDTAESCGADLGRIEIEGEPVALSHDQTMALNLTVHELCTNAIKHGALSSEVGKVDVSWTVDGEQVRLLWCESGGRAIQPPVQKGFGMELIESRCPFELNGEVQVRFGPTGLECELVFPLRRYDEDAAPAWEP